MEFLKSITGRIISGAVALAVVAGGITWWQMDASTRQTIETGTGRVLLWLGIVLAWPWASFAIIGRVARMESNMAAGLLVLAYTLLETLLLAWLFHWQFHGASGCSIVVLAALTAGVYNLLSCDWIAEKI
jgi:FtsH-binding integral membrane protein